MLSESTPAQRSWSKAAGRDPGGVNSGEVLNVLGHMPEAIEHIDRTEGPLLAVRFPELVQGSFWHSVVVPEVSCD